MRGEALTLAVVCWGCETQGRQDLGILPELVFIVILFLF